MKNFKESTQKHLYFSVAFACSMAFMPMSANAGTSISQETSVQAVQQSGNHKVTGKVVDASGEPLLWSKVRPRVQLPILMVTLC